MAWLPKRQAKDAEHPVTALRRDMQRMMDDFLHGWWTPAWAKDVSWMPALDVRETETDVVVEAETPGLKPEDLDVSVADGTLTIRGERKSELDTKQGDYHLSERSHGSFCRTVALPASVDADRAAAKCENGILRVTLPKTEESKAKKVKVSG